LVTNLAKQHDLFFIEDVCDALGAKYNGKMVGTFGDASTFSFYPAHHITTGEGGAVLTNSADIKLAVESYRDWGRDCWCETGHDATCGKRYSQQFGDLPYGYDHKYVYTRLGYNLKMTEMQAAIGAVQMIKLPWFVEQRQRNFARLHDYIMMMHEDFFIIPKAIEDSEPSWFGFPLTIRGGAPFTRSSLIDYLDRARIDSRLLFAGNMVRQPAMINMEYEAEDLTVSDKVMNDTFWLGVHPSLTTEMIDYMIETIGCFIKEL
jgi:CDP-6-deoxy-D-xylo-4-hexulose-3-dehydrase